MIGPKSVLWGPIVYTTHRGYFSTVSVCFLWWLHIGKGFFSCFWPSKTSDIWHDSNSENIFWLGEHKGNSILALVSWVTHYINIWSNMLYLYLLVESLRIIMSNIVNKKMCQTWNTFETCSDNFDTENMIFSVDMDFSGLSLYVLPFLPINEVIKCWIFRVNGVWCSTRVWQPIL